MTFIDRDRDVAELRRLAEAPPGLAIVRGRRRVGKTALVRHALAGSRVVVFQADEQPVAEQLEAFAREAARLVPGAPQLRFGSWDDACSYLDGQAQHAPLTVVLDEFQYLCRSEPALPSIVQRWWDRWQRHTTRLTVVLVGSALSFMEGLLDHGSPLYGRASFRPVLEPFDYRVAAEFAPDGTAAEELVSRFAVLGGIPQYQLWAGRRRAAEAIRDLVLASGAPMHDEPLQLLRAEEDIRDPRRYFGALVAVGGGRTRTNEIAQVIGADASNTAKLLDRLQVLGYLEQVHPAGTRERGVRGVWRVADPFLRFWFRHVFPHRSRLAAGRLDEVWSEIERDLDGYVADVFEDCCRDWFARYAGLDEARDAKTVGRWWSRDGQVEIDVAATDRRGRYTFLGTCKWHKGLVGRQALRQLQDQRAQMGAPAAGATLGVFARRGFSPGLHDEAQHAGVPLIRTEDLFDR